jgi:hypothetical protein
MNANRSVMSRLRDVLAKAGFGELELITSTSATALIGFRGTTRVTVELRDRPSRSEGRGRNHAVPEAYTSRSQSALNADLLSRSATEGAGDHVGAGRTPRPRVPRRRAAR